MALAQGVRLACLRRGKYSMLVVGKRRLFQCPQRRTQTSVTAGTIFASTRLPLKIWFQAIYRLAQSIGYRFNRRSNLASLFIRLAWVSLRTPPMLQVAQTG